MVFVSEDLIGFGFFLITDLHQKRVDEAPILKSTSSLVHLLDHLIQRPTF